MKKIIYITLLLVLVFSCKKDEVSEVYTTDLELVVTNQFNVPVAGANVFLFDNAADYEVMKNGNQGLSLANKATNTDGKVVFAGLDESIKYYFHVISGENTNQQTDFTLKENLTKGAVTTAVIVLESTDSYLIFSTNQSNANNLPIDIFVDGVKQSSVNNSGTDNAIQVSVEDGIRTYKAIGVGGCYWEGEIDVAIGESKSVVLESCNTGSVVFYSSAAVDSRVGITITLSQTDEIGTITAKSDIIPDCTNPAEGIVVTRPVGTYLYRAVSGDCLWTGTVTISANGCGKVEIAECE